MGLFLCVGVRFLWLMICVGGICSCVVRLLSRCSRLLISGWLKGLWLLLFSLMLIEVELRLVMVF